MVSGERQIPLVVMQSLQNAIRRTTRNRHRILCVSDTVALLCPCAKSSRLYVVLALMVSLIAWQGFPSAWAQRQINDATSVRLVGVGGTFPFPIYQKWIDEYGRSHPGVHFQYVPAGSAEGIDQASNGMSDFGGSDVPLTDRELAAAPTKLLLLPSVLGGVVAIYNLPGITQELRFTPEMLAGIYPVRQGQWESRPLGDGDARLDWVRRAYICPRETPPFRLDSERGRKVY